MGSWGVRFGKASRVRMQKAAQEGVIPLAKGCG